MIEEIHVHRETVCSKFKSTWQSISRMYNAAASGYGGTISEGYFLLNIDSKAGSFASDIAQQIGMESTSLSRMIKKLEYERLITRKGDENDKRKVKLVLTAKGKEKKELAKTVVRNFNHIIEDKLGAKKIEEFFKTADLISSLADNYKNKTA